MDSSFLSPLSMPTRLAYNGPAIKKVNVAERVKAVTTMLFCYEQGGYTQPEGEKHGTCFCSPGTSYLSYMSVALQIINAEQNRVKVHKI